MEYLAINNVEMPVPSTLTPSSYDIVDASRNDRGDMLIDYIATKEKLSCSWDLLYDSERAKIINAIKSPQNISFNVTFFSVNGGIKTLKCYKGDISAGIKIIKNGVPYWGGLKVDFIQM